MHLINCHRNCERLEVTLNQAKYTNENLHQYRCTIVDNAELGEWFAPTGSKYLQEAI